MTGITDEKKREAMNALRRALDVAMFQTLAARIPECGSFGAIAQDLDFAFPILTAALSPAPQALAGEAAAGGDDGALVKALMRHCVERGGHSVTIVRREDGIERPGVAGMRSAIDLTEIISLVREHVAAPHAREQAERITRLEAALRWYANLPEDWEIITTTGGRMGDLQLLGENARAALAEGGRDNG